MSQDLYLQLEGIEGESTDFGHKGWIELESFDFGAKQSGLTADGGPGGKVSFTHINIAKFSDISSPLLLQGLVTNKPIKKATIECCQAAEGQHVRLRIILTDVTIANMQVGQDDGKGAPMETLELNYASIEFEYIPINQGGKAQAKYKMMWYIRSQR